MIHNQSDNFIALCALIVSISSIVITIYTLWIQRNHDRLSVKPLADIHYNNLPGNISITLKNGGLGPMKVKSLETYRTDDLKKENLGWPPKTFESLIYTSETSIPIFLSQLEDTPLLNGISLNIFLHTYDVNDPIQVKAGNASKNALKDLTIKIKYTSIYDEEQPERIVPLYHFNDNVTNF